MFLKHVPGTLKKNLLLHDFTFFTLWVLNPCFGEVRTNNSARARPPWNRIWGYCLFVCYFYWFLYQEYTLQQPPMRIVTLSLFNIIQFNF
jgi:hypothetical protein